MDAASKWDVDVPFEPSKAVHVSRQIWGNAPARGTAFTGNYEWYTPAEYAPRVTYGAQAKSVDLSRAS
jgi:hypothetical protein